MGGGGGGGGTDSWGNRDLPVLPSLFQLDLRFA